MQKTHEELLEEVLSLTERDYAGLERWERARLVQARRELNDHPVVQAAFKKAQFDSNKFLRVAIDEFLIAERKAGYR